MELTTDEYNAILTRCYNQASEQMAKDGVEPTFKTENNEKVNDNYRDGLGRLLQTRGSRTDRSMRN